MECAGKISGISRSIETGSILLTLEISGIAIQEVLKLRDIPRLAVKLSKYRAKRSRDANAYAWVLMDQIADVTGTDRWSVYLRMLQDHGVFTHIIVKPSVVEKVKQEWRSVIELGPVTVNGETGIQLQCFFGSSTYNTKEMSRFIDGIVMEAQRLDIDTRTPDEIGRMKQEWGV